MTVIHTRLLFWADGMAVAPGLILIHPSRRGDEPLLAHERTHCQQMREHGWLRFVWRYLTRPSFRLVMEVQAYRAQIKAGGSMATAASRLATGYRLDITIQQAWEMLT